MRWPGLLRAYLERALSGGRRPDDPFYLSNRTLDQKLKVWLAIGVPCLLLAGGFVMAMSNLFHPAKTAPPELTPTEIAKKLLPRLDQDLQLETNKDIEIVEVHVERANGTQLEGSLRNKTGRLIRTVEVAFNLTDAAGSQLGAVNIKVENLAANGVSRFKLPLHEPAAAFALVREVRAQ
jgi:hypothetical protein